MDIKEINRRYKAGDSINDDELNALLNHYTQLIETLKPLREEFELAFAAAIRHEITLSGFKFARETR